MADRHLVYIIGEPGVGKSTLMVRLVQGRRRQVNMVPFCHTVYEGRLVQLGRERGSGFSGTDSLSMSVSPKAIAALETGMWPKVVAEGDRLAHASFFEAAVAAGYRLDVVLLEASEAVLEERRAARGSNQDPSWLAGRKTKVQRLGQFVTMRLDATMPTERLAEKLKDHPVFKEGA